LDDVGLDCVGLDDVGSNVLFLLCYKSVKYERNYFETDVQGVLCAPTYVHT